MNTYVPKLARARRRFRRLAQLLALCSVFVAPLAACSNTKTIQWHEQVKLHDGKVIVVERMQTYRAVQVDIYKPKWMFKKERIQATLPTTPPTTVAWEGPLEPLAIDMTKSGSIYLVAIDVTGNLPQKYKPDNGFHVAFKYEGNNHWERIPREEVPENFKVNLFVSAADLFVDQKYSGHTIDLQLKQKIDSDPRIGPMFRGWDKKFYF